MPRPKSQIPSYRKHSSGNARVTINGRDSLLGRTAQRPVSKYDRLVDEFTRR